MNKEIIDNTARYISPILLAILLMFTSNIIEDLDNLSEKFGKYSDRLTRLETINEIKSARPP